MIVPATDDDFVSIDALRVSPYVMADADTVKS